MYLVSKVLQETVFPRCNFLETGIARVTKLPLRKCSKEINLEADVKKRTIRTFTPDANNTV